MDASVYISRTGLSLPPLEIFDSCGEGESFWMTYNGLVRPDFDVRRVYAPNSSWVSGQKLLAAGSQASTLTLNLIINGISHADLSAKMDELEEAVFQFSYTVSMEIDGQTKTWDADPTIPQWGVVEHLLQDLVKVRGTIQIPIYD